LTTKIIPLPSEGEDSGEGADNFLKLLAVVLIKKAKTGPNENP
jgi:hypothetical protein